MWDPYAKFESVVLANGLTVHVAHWPGRPWEKVGFINHAGAEHDPVGLEGLAHFVEHLVSLNSGIERSVIESFFRDCGGSSNLGITRFRSVTYGFSVPAKEEYLIKAFSFFAKMLFEARIENLIEREREVVHGEFRNAHPNPIGLDLWKRERKALYDGLWLERFVRPLGSQEAINKINQSDLQAYYDLHYTPANFTIVCLGSLKMSEVLKILSLTGLARNKVGQRVILRDLVNEFKPLTEPGYSLDMAELKNSVKILDSGGVKLCTRLPSRIKPMAVVIFKKMLNRLLFEEFRERRAWVYGVDCSSTNYRSFWQFDVELRGLDRNNLDFIQDVINENLAVLADNQTLFEEIKKQQLASMLMLDESAGSVLDNAISEVSYFDRVISTAEEIANVKKLSLSDIREIVSWFRPDNSWTLIVRP